MFKKYSCALVTTGALLGVVCAAHEAHAADAYRFKTTGAVVDTNWTNRFKYPANPGWQGSDSTYSIPLNGFRKLGQNWTSAVWSMFTGGDTFVGWLNAPQPNIPRTRWGYVFPGNTISLFEGQGSGATGSHYFKWKGLPFTDPLFLYQDKNDVAMVRGGNGRVRWPADGTIVNHGFGGTWLVQFWSVVQPAALDIVDVDVATWTTGPVNASTNYPYLGNAGGTWNIGPTTNARLAPGTGYTGPRVMGAAVMNLATDFDAFVKDGFVYVYGFQAEADASKKRGFVARALPTELHDSTKWRYWSGAVDGTGTPVFPSTANSISAAAPMKDTSGNVIQGLASEYSVLQLPNGHFALVYTEADGLVPYTPGTALPTNPVKIVVRTTTQARRSPAGPWGPPVVVYTVNAPATGNTALGLPNLTTSHDGDVYHIYGGKAHPQYSKREVGTSTDGELLISFNVNTFGTKNAAFGLADVYRPRFVRVRYHKVANQNQ